LSASEDPGPTPGLLRSLSPAQRLRCSCGPPAIQPQWDRKKESRPFAELALYPHPAPMHLDELLGDAESEPGSPVLSGDRRVRLLKLREEPVDPLPGNADPGVRHPEAKPLIQAFDRDLDPALP